MSTQSICAKERTTGRIWTEEEKDIVWEKVMQAKANDQPPLKLSGRLQNTAPPFRSGCGHAVL